MIPLATYASITQDEFNRIVDQVHEIYKDNSLYSGKDLVIEKHWHHQQGTGLIVDSSIRLPPDKIPKIIITGTVAVAKEIDADAFALLLCHEFGHHLGGAPKFTSRLQSWSTIEGQADYWAASKCLKKYMQLDKDSNLQIVSNMNIPLSIQEKCGNSYEDKIDKLICNRVAMAGVKVGKYFSGRNNSKIDIDFSAPSVSETLTGFRLDKYRDQCRIETFLAGAYCNQDVDKNNQFCTTGDGARPSCWYHPVNEE